MSDIRPKRPARDLARIETAAPHLPAAVPAVAQEAPITPVGPPAVATDTAAAALATAAAETRIETAVERQEATAEDALAAFAEAQTALARGAEQIASELAGMTRSGLAATSDAAIALLGAKSFAEAVEINAGLARRGFDAMLEGSAKVSEIAVRSVTDASRPLLSGFGLAAN
jgi:hypothetical protein